MSNNRQRSAHQTQPPGQSGTNPGTQPAQPISQIEQTFTTLQLPISTSTASNLSASAGTNANTTIAQSIAYRAEYNTQFSRAKAILWETKFIITSLVSKKGIPQASVELQQLSDQFGSDYDKYLIRELLEQIDLKDPNRPSRDRSEPVKCLLLSEELKRSSENPEFLQYFDEISRSIYGEGRSKEFLKEVCSRLKLTPKCAVLIALSLHESSMNENDRVEAAILLKQKLIDYHASGSNKAEPLEEYALHRLLHILRMYPEFEVSPQDSQFENAKKFLYDHHQIKPCSNVALRLSLADSDLISQNPTQEDPAHAFVRMGSGLNNLTQVSRLVEPWEVLIDLGHYSSFNYQILQLTLQDFKDVSERTMAQMLLHLSIHFSGQDDQTSRIVLGLYEANKTGEITNFKKEPNDKIQTMQWHVGHFSRAFREFYSNLNWTRVIESFAELPDDGQHHHEKFDQKAFAFFLQLLNKSKPQNVQVPISLLLDQKWINPGLQLKFILNSINTYVQGEDKTFSYAKCPGKIGPLPEFQDASSALIDIWSSPSVISALIALSDSNYFARIRQAFDSPISACPQYLILSLSQCETSQGSLLFDELVSILMSQFLESANPAQNPVFKKLWLINPNLMIRAICELCKIEEPSASQYFNKILEINQEIKDSLMRFVNCSDFDFAVSYGIIASKRDYLNLSSWLKERVQNVTVPFVNALVKYLFEQVMRPIQDTLAKNNINLQSMVNRPDEKKENVLIDEALEKAHLDKTRLSIITEVLQQNLFEDIPLVRELIAKVTLILPRQVVNIQYSKETEKDVNQYFESVFNADPSVVDQRIAEFINKIRALRQSTVPRDREVHFMILNTFYDEYRFILSFKDRRNLISFAKLFGGIINKSIIEDTLMEISIKFIIQALQNDDNRLTFGIEALKRSYQCLSDFPRQLEEIYSMFAGKIKEKDPEFHKKFVQFYQQTQSQAISAANAANDSSEKATDDGSRNRQVSKNYDAEIQSQGDPGQVDDQKLQMARQKDRGESQKANSKTTDQKNALAGIKAQAAGKSVQDKRKSSPDHQMPNRSGKDMGVQQQSAFQGASASGLNIQSEAFNRLPIKEQSQSVPRPNINVNAMTFNPNEQTAIIEPPLKQYVQSIEAKTWQENIDRLIQEARVKKQEIRFEDVIEDPLLKQISSDDQKAIRFICNNTGTSTFDKELEKAQKLLQGPNAEQNLNWFLHYFLVQRLLGVPQLNIYIQLFQQLGTKNVVSKAIKISIDIMKRCMLIPEEEFFKVIKKSGSQTNIIKQFLQQLGTFVGSLTLASNRPIFSTELDLKQLLIEGFMNRNKYVIIFVCNILRQAPKNNIQIFNRTNPWVTSLLEILREIYDPQKQGEESQTEIQLVFKEFQLNIHEFQSSGFLKAKLNNTLNTYQMQSEVIFYEKRELIIPLRILSQSEINNQNEQKNAQRQQNNQESEDYDNELRRHNNQQKIYQNVVITANPLLRTFKISEQDYRKVISEALERSIEEILPPVVTRSVSIALITTKQLVLKDFTYDSDVQKVTDAINQFAKNSAGSLALVTCREPLRIALKEFLKKGIEMCCFKQGTRSGIVNGDELRMRDQSEKTLSEAFQMDDRINQCIQEHEEMINEVSNNASQENLELGCNIIKSTVFDDMSKRILQDEDIQMAMERRRVALQRHVAFVDEEYVGNFMDLPELLRPNVNGLTPNQLRVYSDFSKLNQRARVDSQVVSGGSNFQTSNQSLASHGQHYPGERQETGPGLDGDVRPQRFREPQVHSFNLSNILSDIDKDGHLTSFTRTMLVLKISEINKGLALKDEQQVRKHQEALKILWKFTEKKFIDLQMYFENHEQRSLISANLEILSLIIKRFDEFKKKLLSDVFLRMEEIYLYNVELNITLISQNILPLPEWDKAFSTLIANVPGNQVDKVVNFLVRFTKITILNQQIQTMRLESIPKVIAAMKSLKFENDSQSQILKQQLQQTLAEIATREQSEMQRKLKSFFLKWVELSYIADTASQEQEMNSFFKELSNFLAIEKDPANLFEFCNVSVRTSIELTKQSKNGELRTSNALLNYHFIDSFIKLVVLLLKAFEFNKQEFMSKLLQFIQVKLDEDHTNQLKLFNQKPYHRMLINILTAVNISDCFNARTQRQVLFDMADLFSQLKPQSYPAFAFAWLELISHRLFMPHFIKRQDPNQNQAWFQIKDLLVACFSFLKQNMIVGQQLSRALDAFYVGTIRIVLLILKDYPDFLCDFHFNFVNSLPDHAIQLKNMILAAVPRSIQAQDPYQKDLRLDIYDNVKEPRILSNFEAYLGVNNLKEDLDNYFKSKKPSQQQVLEICQKMIESKERINGVEQPSSAVINAVVLYIITQHQAKDKRQKDDSQLMFNELFMSITANLDEQTRHRFLNSIVNELRYPNSHTYFSCLNLNHVYSQSPPDVQEQIQRILFERLQSHRPHPWGLSINFRELLQNSLYGFMNGQAIQQNKKAVDYLFSNRLRPFEILIEEQKSQKPIQSN